MSLNKFKDVELGVSLGLKIGCTEMKCENVVIQGGGTIEGNLEVKGDGEFENLNVINTLTADTIISRETVETKDTLIHLGVDNATDTSNLGAFWEYDNGGKKYGGLVRSAGQKKVYLFKDETVKPTPSSIIVNYPREDLVLNNLESKNTHAQNNVTVGDETDNGATALLNTGFSQFSRYESVAGGVGFEKFKARGDQSTPTAIVNNDVICTNIANGHDGTSFVQTGRDSYVANENFSAGNNGTRYELEITPDGTATKKKYLELTGAHLAIGDVAGSTDYKLPTTRGTLNQILKTDGAGVVTWTNSANPFDQDLNTTDVVEFKGVDTRSTAETGGVILGQFDVASFWAHQDNIGGPILQLNKSRGTKSAPLACVAGDRVSILSSRGFNGSVYPEVAHTRVYATEPFTGSQTGTRLEHSITPSGQTGARPYFELSSSGLRIGDIFGAVSYTLPVARGTNNQILKTDASGDVTWQSDNPFDQSLNTTDSVSFTSMTAGDADTNMTLNSSGVNVYKLYKNTVNGPTLETRRGRGTNAAKLPPLLNDTLAEYVMRGYNGSGEVVSSAIVSRATENWSFGNTGSRMEISITPTGTGLSVPFLDLKDNGLDIGNITAGTNYTLPVVRGDYCDILKTDGNGGVSWARHGNYSKTDTTVVENTITKTSITGTGVGSLSIPAWNLGDVYHLKMAGVVESEGKSEDLKIIAELGAVTIWESDFIDLDDLKTEVAWEVETDFVVKSLGVAGDIYANGQFVYSRDNNADGWRGLNSQFEANVDTTTNHNLNISAQWTNAKLGNIFTCKMIVVTKLF